MPSKSLRDLNNGWPFGDGPMSCRFRFEIRDQSDLPGGEVHYAPRVFMVCAVCPQAIQPLTDVDCKAINPAYTFDLATLKARVVDHWLKCHEDRIAAQTWW